MQRRGYGYVVLAAAIWAVSGTVSKFLFHEGLTPFQLVQLRTSIACASLFAWMLLFRRQQLVVTGRDLPCLGILGVALASTQFTYLLAISKIHVAAAILLQYQAPVIIAIYSALFLHVRPSRWTAASVLGAVAGCSLMVGAYNLDLAAMNREGIAAGLASAVTFAWYTVQSEYGMRTYAPLTVLFYALLSAALIWNVGHPPLASFAGAYRPAEWAGILFIGLFGTVLPYGLYTAGIRIVRSTSAGITATLEPVFAGVIAFLFLGEAPEPLQLIGAALVIFSVALLQARRTVA